MTITYFVADARKQGEQYVTETVCVKRVDDIEQTVYSLDYAKELDKQQIDYEVEFKHIKYWNKGFTKVDTLEKDIKKMGLFDGFCIVVNISRNQLHVSNIGTTEKIGYIAYVEWYNTYGCINQYIENNGECER